MSILEVKDLRYSYDSEKNALDGVSMKFDKGEKIAIIGNNGAGKSTFFLCLNGIIRPDGGELFLQGEKIKHNKKSLIALRKKVGIVFQDADDQIVAATVEQDVS